MPLVFPIALSARAALDAEPAARTQSEAVQKVGGPATLVSEWLRPAASERAALQPQLDRGAAHGFVQAYEDDKGRPVIAVTFWKPHAAAPEPSAKDRSSPLAPAAPPQSPRQSPKKSRKRHRVADTRQLDLFSGPDQAGHESPDPHNPSVVLVEEEGVGAAFGLSTATPTPPAPRPPRRPKTR